MDEKKRAVIWSGDGTWDGLLPEKRGVDMITSSSNRAVRDVVQFMQKAKARNKQGVFVAEGIKMFEEAPAAQIERVYIARRMETQMREQYGEKLRKLSCEIVADDVFDKMADTKTPQGVLCLVRQFHYGLADMLAGKYRMNSSGMSIVMNSGAGARPDGRKSIGAAVGPDGEKGSGAGLDSDGDKRRGAAVNQNTDMESATGMRRAGGLRRSGRQMLFILLEDLQDPGNLGTIFRTGEGAGVDGIIMSRQTVDVYNPKVIRSTMGSVYRVPFLYVDDLCEVIRTMQEHNISVYAAHLKGKKYYDCYDYRKGTAFVIGNESAGLKEETAGSADEYIRIPMAGKVESLNAAVASSILLYEAGRQRRK